MTGDVEEQHLLHELVETQTITFVFGGDQRGEQIVGRVRALPLDRLVDVSDDVVDRVERRELFLTSQDRVERLHDRARPFAQLVAVSSFGNAEHLGDHHEGEWEREIGDEVHLAGVAHDHGVEMAVDEFLHARVELFDGARREHLRHEAA